MFQMKIQAWQQNTPTQEEVEDTLEGYATLAQTPVVVH
jgi:ribosomal protein L30E